MSLSEMPAVNAALNGTAAILLVTGFACIRARRIAAHRACMLAAVAVSAIFLACYLAYHCQVGSVPYRGTGWMRRAYFSILLSHTVLAVVIVPMVLRTLWFALKGQLAGHRRLARWTLPLWVYVSVTGVLVYLMLYRGPGRG